MPYIKIIIFLASWLITLTAQSAISLDRTRIIFNGADKSITVRLSNDNTQLPYLAHSWLENDQQMKISTGPLIVTPPLQRIDPGKKSMVLISATEAARDLPQDRESFFYFSLAEIPPKNTKENTLQLALHTKIKVFYRPQSLQVTPNSVWQDKLVLYKIKDGFKIENPTGYFITVSGIGSSADNARSTEFSTFMLAPKSERTIKSQVFSQPFLTYINDYGGQPALAFQCINNRCSAEKK